MQNGHPYICLLKNRCKQQPFVRLTKEICRVNSHSFLPPEKIFGANSNRLHASRKSYSEQMVTLSMPPVKNIRFDQQPFVRLLKEIIPCKWSF